MTKIYIQKLKDLLDKEKITSNKRLLVYLFFVGVSTIFWFLNALSKEYVTTICYPITYINFPVDKIQTKKLPEELDLRVKAYGFELLRYQLSTAFLSNPFDVNGYTNNKMNKESVSRYVLQTNMIREKLEKDLLSGIELLQIMPDTISFEFSPILKKKVPVKLNIETQFEKQFMLGGAISLNTDSVSIKGARKFLDQIHQVETEKQLFDDLNKTLTKKVDLIALDGVEIFPNEVAVKIPVDQFTEAQKNINLRVSHLPDSLLLRLFPSEVKVSYFVGLKKYEHVSVDLFDLSVDYQQIKKTTNDKLKVKLNSHPDYISNVRFYPQEVSFLLEKKEQ